MVGSKIVEFKIKIDVRDMYPLSNMECIIPSLL